ASKSWYRVVEPALINRMLMLRAIEAGYFSGKASQQGINKSHPINLMDRTLSILIPYLIMSNPKLLITSKKKEYRPFAKTTEMAFNHLIEEIRFARNSLRPVVRDAMLGLGILKTGLMKSHEVEIFGHRHEVGQVYSDPVDLVDYIGDPSATSFEGFEFEGNYFKIPVDAAKEMFPKHVDKLNASYTTHGAKRENDPQNLAKSNDHEGQYSTLREYVRLAEYWIPDENIKLIIEPSSATILQTIESDSPEGGPYDKLYFKDFPGSSLPIPPLWYSMDLDAALNSIVVKMRKQAESQKSNLVYEGEAADDAERLVSAPDQGSIKVSDTKGVDIVTWPGIDPQHYNWANYLENQFSMQNNNLYLLGGQGTGAETLGQDQLQFANASKSVDDMTDKTYSFTQSAAKKMIWYFWSDPLISIPMIKRIQGFGDIPVVFDRAARDGEFWDYEFNIEPYSLQRLSATIEFQRTLSLITQWILPSAQLAAQQGAQINIPKATQLLAKMGGLRGFSDWYETAVPNTESQLNPYSPTQGKVKNKDVQDGRTGANPNSAIANSRQKLERNESSL
ncbi:hypothetical protein LCGC14_2070020, partial [marine sediment metagenome]